MGLALQTALASSAECTLESAIDKDDPPPKRGDLVIDFSCDEGTKSALATSERLSAAILIGTTALSDSTMSAIHNVATRVPVMVTSNASLGVAVVRQMAELATRALGPSWRVRLVETHHKNKLDFPSGTALSLAQSIRDVGGSLPNSAIESIREGDIVGRHEIEFSSDHECITLQHEALDRSLFAEGALQLGLWLRNRSPGLHTMQQWMDDRLQESKSS